MKLDHLSTMRVAYHSIFRHATPPHFGIPGIRQVLSISKHQTSYIISRLGNRVLPTLVRIWARCVPPGLGGTRSSKPKGRPNFIVIVIGRTEITKGATCHEWQVEYDHDLKLSRIFGVANGC